MAATAANAAITSQEKIQGRDKIQGKEEIRHRRRFIMVNCTHAPVFGYLRGSASSQYRSPAGCESYIRKTTPRNSFRLVSGAPLLLLQAGQDPAQ